MLLAAKLIVVLFLMVCISYTIVFYLLVMLIESRGWGRTGRYNPLDDVTAGTER